MLKIQDRKSGIVSILNDIAIAAVSKLPEKHHQIWADWYKNRISAKQLNYKFLKIMLDTEFPQYQKEHAIIPIPLMPDILDEQIFSLSDTEKKKLAEKDYKTYIRAKIAKHDYLKHFGNMKEENIKNYRSLCKDYLLLMEFKDEIRANKIKALKDEFKRWIKDNKEILLWWIRPPQTWDE